MQTTVKAAPEVIEAVRAIREAVMRFDAVIRKIPLATGYPEDFIAETLKAAGLEAVTVALNALEELVDLGIDGIDCVTQPEGEMIRSYQEAFRKFRTGMAENLPPLPA